MTLIVRPQEVTDLVGERKARCCAGMVHNGESVLGFCIHPGSKPAALVIVDDEDPHVRPKLVAEAVHLIHVAVALIGEAPDMVEVGAGFFGVVRLIGVNQTQFNVTQVAHSERFVGFFDCESNEISLNVGIVARRFLRIGDNHIDRDALQLGACPVV